MVNGKCQVCKGGCDWSLHKNMSFKFETSTIILYNKFMLTSHRLSNQAHFYEIRGNKWEKPEKSWFNQVLS